MDKALDVALVSSTGEFCGIAAHSRQLMAAVRRADRWVHFETDAQWLDPNEFAMDYHDHPTPAVIHLNYHLGLHSRWTAEEVEAAARIAPVVLTFHDTYQDGHPKLWELLPYVEAAVVHEPVHAPMAYEFSRDHVKPKLHYLRQGVPAPQPAHPAPNLTDRPVLGTVGHPFPWKNYPLLIDATREAGWGLVICVPTYLGSDVLPFDATHVTQYSGENDQTVLRILAGCDATAFMYTCANSGTSGAIRQGIATGKPVIATTACRQFRDLAGDPQACEAITWADPTLADLVDTLEQIPLGRFDPRIVRLRERDSWRRLGATYATLYRAARATWEARR